jgi:hypothetical protein
MAHLRRSDLEPPLAEDDRDDPVGDPPVLPGFYKVGCLCCGEFGDDVFPPADSARRFHVSSVTSRNSFMGAPPDPQYGVYPVSSLTVRVMASA